MSDFNAARLQRGESHPSKFRISWRSLETGNPPSPSTAAFEAHVAEGKDHAVTNLNEKISLSDHNLNSSPASQLEATQDSSVTNEQNIRQRRRSSVSNNEALVLSSPVANKKKQKPAQTPQSSAGKHKSIPTSMPPPSGPIRFFIASLGNPPPYHTTRHSAGHILLKRLQSHLSLPPLSKSKNYAGGHISLGSDAGLPQWTLWQSPSLMNTSGLSLLKAYKVFLTNVEREEATSTLVIIHDEMETQPAQLKLRRGATSPKGHNGIKSVQQTFQSAGILDKLNTDGQRFLKVAVGIGRPPGGTRDKDDVSAFVLGQLSSQEKAGIEGSTGQLVQILEGEMGRISRGA